MKTQDTSKKMLQQFQNPLTKHQLYKKTLKVIFIAQAFGGAGLGAGISVGALLIQEMTNSDKFTGLPVALFTLGSALAAFLIGGASQKFGRRLGLASGFLLGGLGGLGIVLATIIQSIPFLLTCMFIYGAGMASSLQARYAGTDLAEDTQRGTAASIALVSITLGAVAGPNLIGPMSNLANLLGIPTLTGPFIMSGIAFFIAGCIIWLFLKPDPLLVSISISENYNKSKDKTPHTYIKENQLKGIIIGAFVMILSQLIMTAIMTATPIHMAHNGHELYPIGIIIGLHIASMYLPSPIIGKLIDKFGCKMMVSLTIVIFLLAGFIAALSPTDSLNLLALALVLLGIGWNIGLLTGTAILIDATALNVRAKIQGRVDVFVALAGATSGTLSGVIITSVNYSFLSTLSALIALLLLFPLLLLARKKF